MATDPKVIAMRLAVARWKKMPDDPIAQELDEPHEWVREAGLMNKFLPNRLLKEGISWQTAHPAELRAAGIQKVRQYAGFLFSHMKPLVLSQAQSIGDSSDADLMSAGGRLDDFDSAMFFASALGLDETDIKALY
ncbi:MAG TPA: hypothetical protein VJZ00_21740 [Thermoanaerobaculia bacterium]|nr:hypothetical protein [Thermoanaerobaculia bacterium]